MIEPVKGWGVCGKRGLCFTISSSRESIQRQWMEGWHPYDALVARAREIDFDDGELLEPLWRVYSKIHELKIVRVVLREAP